MQTRLTAKDIQNLKIGNYVYIPFHRDSNPHPLDPDSRWWWTTAKVTGFTLHPKTNKPAIKVQYIDTFNAGKLSAGIIGLHMISGWSSNSKYNYDWFINHPSFSRQIQEIEDRIKIN
jgi:hypothetical protein